MPTRKAAPKKAAAKKVPAKKAAAKKAVAKTAVAKKAVAKKAPAKKAVAKKATAKKATVKKAPAKKAVAKKATAKKAPARKAPARPTRVPTPTSPPPPLLEASEAIARMAPPIRETVTEQEPGAVVVGFEGPGPQRRLTVAFRLILAIPHILYAYVLFIAGFFAIIAAWFAALALGRVPDGLATFLGRILQYDARLIGYGQMFLTDRYPPFSLDATDYPISVDTAPTKLNRAAVFFRLILVIPASIVATVVLAGQQVVAVVAWLIVLISGRLPASLFEAHAATLRYVSRYYAYFGMLTAEYPRGLFGDKTGDGAEPSAPPTGRPRITRLVLSQAARRLVILFIVLGALVSIGSSAGSIANSARSTAVRTDVREAHDRLESDYERFVSDGQTCAASSSGIDCLHTAARQAAIGYQQFALDLVALKYPSSAITEAEQVIEDARQVILSLRRLTEAPAAAYQAGFADFQRLRAVFEDDYQALLTAILF